MRRYGAGYPGLGPWCWRTSDRRYGGSNEWLAPSRTALLGASRSPSAGTRQSLGAWIRRNTRTRRRRALIETGPETIWPLSPDELSLLHALVYIRFAGSLDALVETSGGAQEERFVGGSYELAARLAAGLQGRIELGAPVSAVCWFADGVRVTAAGSVYMARKAFAMSPTLWGRCSSIRRCPSSMTSSPSACHRRGHQVAGHL